MSKKKIVEKKTLAAPAGDPEKQIETVEVTTAEMLDSVCKEEITAEFVFKGKLWKVKGRMLTPGERDRVDLILERALPDLLAATPGADGAEARYDLRNPKFLEDKSKFKAQARALALFLAYPIIANCEAVKKATAGNPVSCVGATTPYQGVNIDALTGAVQSMFTQEILEALWWSAIGTSKLWERANFF